MTQIVQLLADHLNDNKGNRITPALITGLLYIVDKQLAAEAQKPPVEPPAPTEGI
jgi:hypothetical protein